MSPVRRSCVLGGLVLVGLAAVPAVHATEIDHKAVGCVVAEQFPRLEARLIPVDSVGRARIFFRTEGGPSWYAVAMKREGDVFLAALPKPKKSLKQFHYYVEVADKAAATSRTEEYATDVVAAAGGCSKGMMAGVMSAASILLEVPAGAAAIPVGFSSAGVVAAGSTAAAGAGGAAASSGGGGLSTAATAPRPPTITPVLRPPPQGRSWPSRRLAMTADRWTSADRCSHDSGSTRAAVRASTSIPSSAVSSRRRWTARRPRRTARGVSGWSPAPCRPTRPSATRSRSLPAACRPTA